MHVLLKWSNLLSKKRSVQEKTRCRFESRQAAKNHVTACRGHTLTVLFVSLVFNISFNRQHRVSSRKTDWSLNSVFKLCNIYSMHITSWTSFICVYCFSNTSISLLDRQSVHVNNIHWSSQVRIYSQRCRLCCDAVLVDGHLHRAMRPSLLPSSHVVFCFVFK